MNINNKTSNYIIRTVVSNNFISDINKIPVLTREEEKNLFIEYEASQMRVKAAEGQDNYMEVKNRESKIQDDIKNEIITRNQRFNLAVAKRYCGDGLVMELVNVGAIGMYEAFQKYNYKTDNRFCSFAVWYIRRAINAFLVRENVTVRTTNNTKIIHKVKDIENSFFAKEGRYPSDSEIKAILEKKYNITDADVTEFHKVLTPSIDEIKDSVEDDYNETHHEFSVKTAAYNDYESISDNDNLKFVLNNILKSVSERERIIMCMSAGYGYDKEYKDYEIAEELNMSTERIRQIKNSVKQKLAKKLMAHNIA